MNTTNILNGVTLASRDEVTEHTENATMHLTDEERNTWNAKADASALAGKVDTGTFTAHETNPTVHVSQEEREKWNARTTKGVVTATQDGLDEHTENAAVHIPAAERASWESGVKWVSKVSEVMKMNAPLNPSHTASLSSQEGLALGAGARANATGAGWAIGMNSTCDCNQISLALGHLSCVTGDYAMAVGVGAVCANDSTIVISAYNQEAQLNAALGLEVDDAGNEYLWVASFDHLMGNYSSGVRISLPKLMDMLRANGGENYTPKGSSYSSGGNY